MKILWIKTSPLHPLNRGGDLRTFHMLRAMQARHEIHFCGLVSSSTEAEGSLKSELYATESSWLKHRLPEHGSGAFYWGALSNYLFSGRPYAVDRYYHASWAAKVKQVLDSHDYDRVVCDFLFPSASLLPLLDQPRQQPWVIFQHNVEAKIWERRADCSSPRSRFYWRSQYRRMWEFEQRACSKFDGVIAVSDKDAEIFREEMGLSNVLGSVPTGVDVSYFQSPMESPLAPVELVFLGSMDWHANVDGMIWFLAEVWPLLRAKRPEIQIRIVGRNPSPELVSLAQNTLGVEVTGTVPDVRPYLKAASVAVVPLRIGGGTRIKIFECMAAGLPVVSTSVGAEGLNLEANVHLRYADDAHALAEQVLEALNQPEKSAGMVQRSLEEIQQHYSWDAAARQFEHHLEALV